MNARLRAYFRPHPLPIYVIPVAFMSSTIHVQCKEIISKDLLASFLTCTDKGLCGNMDCWQSINFPHSLFV